MADGGTEQARIRITDPQVMRALAHPARIDIIEHLSSTGESVTATQMAALVGLSPSATSYHLRELAKYGLVEHAASQGDGRERRWQGTSAGWNLEGDDRPESRAAEKELVDVYLSRDFARLTEWLARSHDEPAQWRRAGMLMGQTLMLTAEELQQVNEAVREALRPYERRRRTDPPEAARPVALQYAVFPTD